MGFGALGELQGRNCKNGAGLGTLSKCRANGQSYTSFLFGIGLFHSTVHKMEFGALGELQGRNCKNGAGLGTLSKCRANGQSYTSFLSPILPSKRDTKFGGSQQCIDDIVDWLQRTALSI